MSRSALRILLTILMYFGAGIFLLPYAVPRLFPGVLFLIGGTLLALVCGLLRSCLTEGTCSERTFPRPCP